MLTTDIDISALIPYARNPRNNTGAVDKVAASIKEFGFRQPIVVDTENVIIAGHTRYLAAQKLGIDTVPVHIAEGLTAQQVKAYRLADNKVSEAATWDMELLALELPEIDGLFTGFDQDEIDALLHEDVEGLTDEDAVPEMPEDPITVEGDVWILGNHRLMCGDATNVGSWEKLNIGHDFIIITSPPYNVGDASGLRDKYQKGVPKSNKFYNEYSDDKSSADYTQLLSDTLSLGMTFCDAAVFNVQPLAGCKRELIDWMNMHSSNMVDVITWDKGHGAPHIQPGIMASRFEWLVIYSSKENASRVIPYSSWQGKYTNVYLNPGQQNNDYASVHGATFPTHLPEYIAGDLMNRSRGIVDCFAGTGTSLIAAEKLGKQGCMIELDPKYCDVIVKRWQDFTGKTAILENDDTRQVA